MSETMSWSERVKKGARRYPYRPYENNETSYKNLCNTYGFQFDEYLCPIRGKDRNYMVGPFGQESWWTIWFPTDAEKNNKPHLLREWEDRIAAAVKPRGKAVYELSWAINVLPLLPEGSQPLSDILRGWFEQSAVNNFGQMFADAWRDRMRGAVANMSAIVTWSRDGSQSYDIKSAEAVRVIDKALEILGLSKPPEPTREESAMPATKDAQARAAADKPGPQEKLSLVDFGESVNKFLTKRGKRGGRLYLIAPPAEVAEEWGLPEEAVSFFVRPDGAGRLRVYEGNKEDLDTSRVQDMDRHPVSLGGYRAVFEWRSLKRRAVAQFTPAQVQAIVGVE